MDKALTNRVIILSFDCLSALDFPILQKLPHFQSLIKKGTVVEKVEPIYPSVTYPSHSTIVTGNYPNKHGVVSNTLLQPGRESPDWHWYRKSIQGTTLYDEAHKANLTTAALLWPVTGRANIDYNLPEIFPNRPWQNQVLVSLFSGSPLYQLDLNRRFGHIRNGLSQPELDDFVLASAVHTIQTKKPNVMFVHFTDLDTQRHYHGFESKETIAAIHRHDERLGKIIQALKDSGLYEESTIIALGDHSALSESKAIQLNVLFHQKRAYLYKFKRKISRLECLLPKLRWVRLCICERQKTIPIQFEKYNYSLKNCFKINKTVLNLYFMMRMRRNAVQMAIVYLCWKHEKGIISLKTIQEIL